MKIAIYSLGFLLIYVPALINLFKKSSREFLIESEKRKSAYYFVIGVIITLIVVSAIYWPKGRFRYPADIYPRRFRP